MVCHRLRQCQSTGVCDTGGQCGVKMIEPSTGHDTAARSALHCYSQFIDGSSGMQHINARLSVFSACVYVARPGRDGLQPLAPCMYVCSRATNGTVACWVVCIHMRHPCTKVYWLMGLHAASGCQVLPLPNVNLSSTMQLPCTHHKTTQQHLSCRRLDSNPTGHLRHTTIP
jgi:hypothetical protein